MDSGSPLACRRALGARASGFSCCLPCGAPPRAKELGPLSLLLRDGGERDSLEQCEGGKWVPRKRGEMNSPNS